MQQSVFGLPNQESRVQEVGKSRLPVLVVMVLAAVGTLVYFGVSGSGDQWFKPTAPASHFSEVNSQPAPAAPSVNHDYSPPADSGSGKSITESIFGKSLFGSKKSPQKASLSGGKHHRLGKHHGRRHGRHHLGRHHRRHKHAGRHHRHHKKHA